MTLINVSSTNLPNTKEKIFSWIFSKDYLQISEGACDWNLFEIFLYIFYCWFYIDFSLDFKIQNENLEKIYSKIFGRRNKFISLVPRSEILRKSEIKIWGENQNNTNSSNSRYINDHKWHINVALISSCSKRFVFVELTLTYLLDVAPTALTKKTTW